MTRLAAAGGSPAADGRPAAHRAEAQRATPLQRLRATLVAGAAWLICHLPEGPLLRLADGAGDLAWRLSGRRRAQARRNLARVAAWAAGHELGSEATRAAAADPAALDRLVRSAFRHHARYWVELVRAPRMDRAYIRERLTVETPDEIAAAFAAGGPIVFVGLHFGAIELPAFFLAQVAGRRAVGPMETVADPALQAWFVRTRAALGVRIVGLREARRELVAALRAGDAAGLVADRDLTGGGIATGFFGHPAPLPAGPALLVLETQAPTYAVAVRRTGLGRYAGGIVALPIPETGTRRERVEAFLTAEAAAFERFIVAAPEQWWAVFYPIWPDLEAAA